MTVTREVYRALIDVLETALSDIKVYRQIAPPGANWPFVVLTKQPTNYDYTLRGTGVAQQTYLVRAVDQGLSADTAYDIDAACQTALQDQVLTLDGHSNIFLRRVGDVEYVEVAEGLIWQHVGGLYQVEVLL